MSEIVNGKINGFTLIEIMVAVLISAFLFSGVISILLSNKQSYLVKQNVGRMQENLRLSSAILTRTLSMAESVHQDSNAEQVIVSYSGGEGVNDCLGNSVVSGIVVNRFYVKNNTLYCGATYSAMPNSEQPLIDSVARITIQYGVDEGRHGEVDRYTSTPDDWSAVINARIVLHLLNSSGSPLPAVTLTVAMRPRIFSHLNGAVDRKGIGLDRRFENARRSLLCSKGKCTGHQFAHAAGDHRAWHERNDKPAITGANGGAAEAVHCGFTGGGIRSGDGYPMAANASRCLG
jgi:type IV pilus assembly protein PilW